MINTNILSDMSTYDINTHTAYPKLSFIRQEIGEDIVANQGTEDKALSYVRQMTDVAFSILKESKDTLDTINRLEYKIATDEEYRLTFIKYVAKVIYATLIYGADYLFLESDKRGIDRLPIMIKSYVQSSVLSVGVFKYFKYDYHVGY